MKSILLSIKPKWVAKILNGEKTIEVRKKFPKDYKGWVYIYCTKDKKYANLINRGGFLTGMVVARFYCDEVEEIDDWFHLVKDRFAKTCLTIKELIDYLNGKEGYAIHISQLEIFDKPRELWQLSGIRPNGLTYRLEKAPQNMCYVEIEDSTHI